MDSRTITRRDFILSTLAGTISISAATRKFTEQVSSPADKPNILWITSEDNSPLLGCYGDTFATTPNLDKLAAESIVYDNAFANISVCAPARFTILTGMYACSMGTHNMSSRYPIPDFVKPYPHYLREAGYYCTNPGKTDYNYETDDKSHWDEGSYHDRRQGQPFFHIVNITKSHESSIHEQRPTRHDPQKVTLPPYHPDTPQIRQNWAQYYDSVEDMDKEVGKILHELEKDGLAENTIVFYFADHGGVLCRSKRFLYDSGTHVPMMIRFPKKYRHLAPGEPGSRNDRLVSFVDLAPTLLSLAGINIPEHMQGEAFLGDGQKGPRSYVYLFRDRMDERYDMMRAVRDKKYKYIRNYFPHRIYGQHLEYLWKAAATRSWEEEYLAGRCNKVQSIFWGKKSPEELYDITSDPWEVNNLAEDPQYRDVLERMREENLKWTREIGDAGFLPEGEMIDRCAGTTAYELMDHKSSRERNLIFETAEMASLGDVGNLPELIERLGNEESVVRFWAATGCAILGTKAKPAVPVLLNMLNDESADVSIAAAEALCSLEETANAIPVLSKHLRNENLKIALHAANVLDALGEKTSPALTDLENVFLETEDDYLKRSTSRTISVLK